MMAAAVVEDDMSPDVSRGYRVIGRIPDDDRPIGVETKCRQVLLHVRCLQAPRLGAQPVQMRGGGDLAQPALGRLSVEPSQEPDQRRAVTSTRRS